MKRPGLVRGALALGALALIVGCNTGGRSSASKTTPPATFPPTSAPLTLAATVGNATSANLGTQFTALAFNLENQTAGIDVAITSMTVTASGTVDETTAITSASLIIDTNTNGLADVGDFIVSTITVPPFATNDGAMIFSGTSVVLPANSNVSMIVVVEATAPTGMTGDTAIVGSTVILSIAAAADIAGTTTSTTTTVTTTPVPFTGTAVTMGIGTHLLISEISSQPGSGATSDEYIEIFNPTAGPINMSNYHLTDFSDGALTDFYYLLPTGDNFGPAGSAAADDFTVRFPANFTIAAGQTIIVAVDGGGFAAAHPGFTGTVLTLRNPQAGHTQMRIWDGVPGTLNFTAGNLTTQPGLGNNGEPVFLFMWDGATASDLVSDIDLVNYGGTSANNNSVSKTGVAVDGIDTGTATSTYANDLAVGTQDLQRGAAPTASSLTRIDWSEAGEVQINGNGIGRHDETSEPFNTTFGLAPKSPGTP
jgi:hypothetical protein